MTMTEITNTGIQHCTELPIADSDAKDIWLAIFERVSHHLTDDDPLTVYERALYEALSMRLTMKTGVAAHLYTMPTALYGAVFPNGREK